MNMTHTSTPNYLKWLVLSLVLLFTACNKNEDPTLIIYDCRRTWKWLGLLLCLLLRITNKHPRK